MSDDRELLVVLADISGYAAFMLEHGEALRHAFVVVSQLLEAIVREARPPMEIAKLEGDAVFLYALQPASPEARARLAPELGARLDAFFRAFNEKRAELVESNICPCGACRNADRLRLKIVVHGGRAFFHRVGRFDEIAGPDVILAHRLLKNSLPQDEYLLLTEPAHRALEPAGLTGGVEGVETYDGFGTLRVFVHQPPLSEGAAAAASSPGRYASVGLKAKNILIKIFQSRLEQLRLRRRPHFHHLPPPSAEPA